jgi:hypothetical protein
LLPVDPHTRRDRRSPGRRALNRCHSRARP